MTCYRNRTTKAKWVTEQFKSIFGEIKSILDVGCDGRCLKNCLPEGIKYIGLDNFHEADIHFDLDKGKKLPLDNNSFDLVYCSDVLEHLENIHSVFDELCRISRKYIIVSLPNPFSGIFPVLLGRTKLEGLPPEKVEDRHRWFFTNEEAVSFLKHRAEKNGCKVAQITYTIDYQKGVKKLFKIIISGFNRKRMLNWFNGTTWFLIEKQ